MMTPFERVVGDSSKDHTVTAPTFTTRPTTEQLHHYAGRHSAATKVAPRTRERTGLHLPKVRALGRPSHRSRLNDSARNAGTPPAAANIVGWCAKEPKGANDDQSSRRQRDRGRPLPHSSSDGLSSTAWQRSEAWRGHRNRTGPPNAQWSALAAVAVGPVVRPVGGTRCGGGAGHRRKPTPECSQDRPRRVVR